MTELRSNRFVFRRLARVCKCFCFSLGFLSIICGVLYEDF